MTFKRTLALLLTLCMLIGIAGPGLAVNAKAATNVVKVEKEGGETTYHASLQDAFKKHFDYTNNTAMGGKYTVTLLADCDRAEISAKTDSYFASSLDITLDLAGHSIKSSDSSKSVLSLTIGSTKYPATFTIIDSVGGGEIRDGKQGIVFIAAKGTLNFNGGTITNNHGGSTGGGICASSTSNQPTINLNGGVITGNSVNGTSANSGLGGGVFACHVVVNGTIITGNEAKGGTNTASGRGGGIATPINGTSANNIIEIKTNTVYGNSATNSGDDIIAAKNGMSSVKHTLIIGTENWYIDGWNGKKGTVGNGETDRYSAENPVPYTDGGFTQVYNKHVGLKYVAPAAPVVKEYTVTYTDGVDGEEIFADQVYTVKEGEPTPAFVGTPTREGYTFVGWEPAVADTVTADVTYVAQWEQNRPAQPSVPMDNGGNVTPNLITIICDCDANHTPITYGWGNPAANSVFPAGSEPVWDEALGAWTIGVRIDSIQTYYVGLHFNKTYGGIQHEIVGGNSRIDTTLVWDPAHYGWNTLTGEPFEIHVACQAAPAAPAMGYHLNKFQIKMEGEVDGVVKSWSETLHAESVTVGEVKGNRTEGFTVDVTVTLDDSYLAVWLAKFAPEAKATDYAFAPETLTFTLKYTGDTAGELYDGPEYWAATGNQVQTVSVVSTRLEPAGDIVRAYLNPTKGSGRIYVDLLNVAYNDSVELRLYSGEELLTTASLNTTEYPGPKTFAELTGSICVVAGESDTWPNTQWLAFDNVIPDRIELVVDGEVLEVFTAIQGTRDGAAMTAADWAAFPNTIDVPTLPYNNGSNVTPELITVVCDCDAAHAPITYGWGDPAANIIFPTNAEPVWDEALGAWTIGVRLDSLQAYYVSLRFEETYNGIAHELVAGAPLTSDEYKRIDTTLVWNAAALRWETLSGEPFVLHTTCQTAPDAPTFFDHLRQYQIKVIGTMGGEELPYFVNLNEASVSFGQVTGSRDEGFTCEVTITLENGDAYMSTWIAKKAPGMDFSYDFTKTTNPIVLTLKYTGDLTGELNGDWALNTTGYTVATAYLTMDAPAAPEKFGGNVTPDFVEVICDSDPIHHPSVVYKWMHQSVAVVKDAVPVWDAALGAWTIDVKIDSISMYYLLLSYDKEYGVTHELVGENYIITTLKWDAAQQLWVTLDGQPVEIHVTCKTVPDAPSLMGNYQIQVKGDLDHDGVYGEDGELFTTTIPADGCTFGQIYGSRDEGFFIDVTVTLEDGDIYITNWIAKRAPGETYVYNWSKTAKIITFTLKYSGDLNGNLQGSNDWVLKQTGENFGAVGEAFVIPAAPAKPEQKIVTDKLVAIICDSDGDRHETVYAKWYPNHCRTTSDIVWSDELNTYVVDIRIGSLYVMYVNQLEDANNGIEHQLAEDITTVYTTLKWDYDQNLWVTLDGKPIELHTTCLTQPLAPSHDQLDSFQVKVWGDVDGTETAYTTYLFEGSYTVSPVRGSREEGFFVDVVITLKDGDAFVQNWMAKKVEPGITYVYDTERTEMTVTLTLKYTGDLNGTLHGDRNASNTNVDWVLQTSGKNYGVVAEAYVVHHHVPGDPATCITPQVCLECGEELAPSLTDALAEAIAALEEAIAAGDAANAEAIAELEQLVEELRKTVAAGDEKLQEAVDALEEALAALEKAYQDADKALKEVLEQLIADTRTALEETIAALEKRVAQNEETIAALQQKLDELKAQLEQMQKDHEADVSALEAEIEALKAQIAALQEADKAHSEQLVQLAQTIAALEARIAELEKNYATKAALEQAIEDLKALIAAGDNANAEALKAAIAALEQKLADAIAQLESDYQAADEALKTALEALINEAKVELEAAIAQLRKDLEDAVDNLEQADKDNAEALAQAIADLTEAIKAAENAGAAEDAAIRTELAEAKAALEGAIARLRNELYVVRGELLTIMAEGDEALSQKIAELAAALEAATAASQAADEAMKLELTAVIEQTQAVLAAAIEKVAADLAAAQQALNDAIIAGDQDLDHKITLLNEGLTVAIAAADAANEALRTELNARIDEAVATLEAAVAQVRKDLEAAQAALAEKDAQHDAQLEKLNTFVIVVCVIASLALAGCAALLVITVIGKGKKV